MRALFAAPVVLVLLAGCSSAPPRPIVPEPPGPVAISGDGPIVPVGVDVRPSDEVPRSIRRLVAEQRDEVERIQALAERVPDPHGRARAMREADVLSRELSTIEAALDTAESDALDDAVLRLKHLEGRITLIHDALRTAAL